MVKNLQRIETAPPKQNDDVFAQGNKSLSNTDDDNGYDHGQGFDEELMTPNEQATVGHLYESKRQRTMKDNEEKMHQLGLPCIYDKAKTRQQGNTSQPVRRSPRNAAKNASQPHSEQPDASVGHDHVRRSLRKAMVITNTAEKNNNHDERVLSNKIDPGYISLGLNTHL